MRRASRSRPGPRAACGTRYRTGWGGDAARPGRRMLQRRWRRERRDGRTSGADAGCGAARSVGVYGGTLGRSESGLRRDFRDEVAWFDAHTCIDGGRSGGEAQDSAAALRGQISRKLLRAGAESADRIEWSHQPQLRRVLYRPHHRKQPALPCGRKFSSLSSRWLPDFPAGRRARCKRDRERRARTSRPPRLRATFSTAKW